MVKDDLYNQLKNAYEPKSKDKKEVVLCCVCSIPNCSKPVKFVEYFKMTLTDVETHLNTRVIS